MKIQAKLLSFETDVAAGNAGPFRKYIDDRKYFYFFKNAFLEIGHLVVRGDDN